MKRLFKRAALALALVFFLVVTINSPLFAPRPKGYVHLIAHRGAYQLYSHAGLGRDTCTATRIYPPTHLYHENTLAGIAQARRLGAQMVEIDIAPTKDGKIAVFHDWGLECRTNGKGNVRDHTMAELKALDATWGYTADGGKSYPFRGQGVGRIPELGEVLAAFPDTPLLFNFKSKDAAEADLLAAALKAAGRDPAAHRDGFYASSEAGPVARIRTLYPKAWTFSMEAAKACTKAYGWQGWIGMVPEICRGRTIMVPLNYQWAMAGWPDRMIARMEQAETKIVLVAPVDGKDHAGGLDMPEQLRDVPSTFNGMLWVDDIYTIGPALHPALNKRNPVEEQELAREIERRRKARE